MVETTVKVHLNDKQTEIIEEASAKVGLSKSNYCRYLIFTNLNELTA